jgi:hypothetical protein
MIIKREYGEIPLQPPLLYEVTILIFHWIVPGRKKEDEPIVRRPACTCMHKNLSEGRIYQL